MEKGDREEKRARKWKTVEAKDHVFWDIIDDLLARIGPVLGIRVSNRLAYMPGGPGDKSSRIVASQETLDAKHPLNKVYYWLSKSPDCCVPRNGYAIMEDIRTASQIVFNKFVWIDLLQNMCAGGLIHAVASQAKNIWLGGTAEDIWLSGGVIYAFEVQDVVKKVEIGFKAWLDYIKRHSILRIKKKDDEWYLPMVKSLCDTTGPKPRTSVDIGISVC